MILNLDPGVMTKDEAQRLLVQLASLPSLAVHKAEIGRLEHYVLYMEIMQKTLQEQLDEANRKVAEAAQFNERGYE